MFETIGSTESVTEIEHEENKMIPKPFLDPDVLEMRNPAELLYVTEEMMFRQDGMSDHDAINFSDHYPSPQPFDAYKTPFPVRMGKQLNMCVQPDKFANTELLKVNNMLHAAPPTIKKQCSALKELCTKFPKHLEDEMKLEKEFPVEKHTVDYIAAAKNPRDKRARVVDKTVRLCNLALDSHARSKMMKLAGKSRYNEATDLLTITSNRCPLRQQNSDYVDYLFTALYFESWKTERWEKFANAAQDGTDQFYDWEKSRSRKSLGNYKLKGRGEQVKRYSEAVVAVKLEPKPLEKYNFSSSRRKIVDEYKESVLGLLDLKKLQ